MSIAGARVWALGSLAAIAVISFAVGSSSVTTAKHIGHTARWLALVVLCAAALIEAAPRLRRQGLPPGLRAFVWLPTAFVALCLLSVAWSPDPRLTFERTASLGLLFLTAGAIAVTTAVDAGAMRRLFSGLAAGAAAVAAVGLVMLALGAKAAAQPASPQTPWRFRGLGENPNTVAVLAAVALPIVAWLGLTAQTRRSRTLWLAAFVVPLASTIASESRGGLVAAFFGVEAVVMTTVPLWRRRIVIAVVVAIAIVAGVALREVTQPAAPAFYSAVPLPPPGTVQGSAPGNAGGEKHEFKVPAGPPMRPLPPRASEIGHPLLSRAGTTTIGSGRIAVWIGTLKDVVLRRPLLGYGFGTEELVFVDRWYNFQGGTPENSTIGLLLQVGLVGLLLVLALAAVVARGAVRALHSAQSIERSAGRVGLGVLLAALALTFFQAYVYSVGNVATLTVWVVVFLTATATLGSRAGDRGREQ